MPKISLQTKTFIALFCFAVFGTFLCLALWSNLFGRVSNNPNGITTIVTKNTAVKTIPALAPAPAVDTTGWKTYSNKQNQLSFLYKPDWKVLPAVNKDGFTILQIDPGQNITILKFTSAPKNFILWAGSRPKPKPLTAKPL